jgi:hypothetical protein
MKKIAVAFSAAALLAIPATASAAPGQDIKDACGASFGQLVSAGKSSGDAAHQNYAGARMRSPTPPSSQHTVAAS